MPPDALKTLRQVNDSLRSALMSSSSGTKGLFDDHGPRISLTYSARFCGQRNVCAARRHIPNQPLHWSWKKNRSNTAATWKN